MLEVNAKVNAVKVSTCFGDCSDVFYELGFVWG